MPPLKHAILGVGGVGGTLGALLAHLGDSVAAVVRPAALATYPDRFHLESTFGTFNAPISRAVEVPPCDVLWISVKATQLNAAVQAITNPEGIRAIVPLLNGMNHLDWLRSEYGFERVIPATIAGEMERLAPGRFVHRTPFLRLNILSTGQTLLSTTFDGLTRIGLECHFIDDEPTLMWSKMVFLAPFALTTTAADMTVGGVLQDPVWRVLAESCVRETCAVATAEGAKVDVGVVLSFAGKAPASMKSSMQKDVEQGNPPELDAIAGPIIRRGDAHGIDVSVTRKLVDAIVARVRTSVKSQV